MATGTQAADATGSTLPRRRQPTVLDHILGVTGELLITLGVLLLLFVGWQLWWTDIIANQAQSKLADSVRSGWSQHEPRENLPPPGDPQVLPQPEKSGHVFGMLHIPRFGSGWQPRPVLQGISLKELEDGFGHYKDTAMPGQVGNFAIAGHRVTYGRPMWAVEDLQPGDAIVAETEQGWYTYRVTGHEIVRPSKIEVIEPVPNQPGVAATERVMTITACHPKYSARERYIVHATFEKWQPRSYGEPDSLQRPKGVK